MSGLRRRVGRLAERPGEPTRAPVNAAPPRYDVSCFTSREQYELSELLDKAQRAERAGTVVAWTPAEDATWARLEVTYAAGNPQ